MTSYFQWVLRFGRNSADAEWHADYVEMVEIETGSRNPIWRTFVCLSQRANGAILTKFDSVIDFDLLKAATLTNTKPEVVFSGRGRHFEKWIWRHISSGCSELDEIQQMQNDMPITAKWSRLKPEVEFQYGERLYFETGSSYISAANWDRYLDEIWFADRLWPSEGSDINKYETGSSI